MQGNSIPIHFFQQGNPTALSSLAMHQGVAPTLNSTISNENGASLLKSEPSTKLIPENASPKVVPRTPLPDKPDPEVLKLDQGKVMCDLQMAMDRTADTQKRLQEWDRANGLPKSHSQTMVNSSRSRKQLTDGVILKKWNGAPLL